MSHSPKRTVSLQGAIIEGLDQGLAPPLNPCLCPISFWVGLPSSVAIPLTSPVSKPNPESISMSQGSRAALTPVDTTKKSITRLLSPLLLCNLDEERHRMEDGRPRKSVRVLMVTGCRALIQSNMSD